MATKKHGMFGTPEYSAWSAMLYRCYNRRAQNYARYGGMGITVCERWRKSFEAFFDDLGPRPSSQHSLDRKDNNLGYTPENCRWATPEQQTNNRECTLVFGYKGETRPLGEWARVLGISYATLFSRIVERKWPVDRAFSEPAHTKRKLYEHGGEALPLVVWAERCGLKPKTLYKRVVVLGLPIDRAMNTPLSKGGIGRNLR